MKMATKFKNNNPPGIKFCNEKYIYDFNEISSRLFLPIFKNMKKDLKTWTNIMI